MKTTLIHSIGHLFLADTETPALARGAQLSQPPICSNAYVLLENERIIAWGNMNDCPPHPVDERVDAQGGMVLPAWCDSHTHLVFAEPRAGEFVDKINGESYETIAQRGGGILNSARKLQDLSEEVLFERALQRLQAVQRQGTGAIEIKSGYGLTVDAELKMLRVIRRLKEQTNMPIKATFLGAHALPSAYQGQRDTYLKLIIDEMLPQIAAEGLADYMDVFCEKVAFSAQETDQLLEAGWKHGLTPKIHTNQFNSMGGIETALRHNALSVDHLEVVNEAEIQLLANADTIATLLPSAPFFINDAYPPARALVDAGVPIALASDFNPGSSPSGNMAFVVALGCIKLRLLPEEALTAATLHGAYALELAHEIGSISVGKRANLILTQPVLGGLAYLPYSFGEDWIRQVWISGQPVR